MIYRRETTVSTNLDARSGCPGDVFTAEFQTAGRGRLDHAWQSRRSENLMFSMVLSGAGGSPAEIATLPLVVGLAVVSALSRFRLPLAIKWPNDILAGGRKLCGILCERFGGNVIAGVGVNVNQTVFAPDISERSTSLALETGRPADREEILREIVSSVSSYHGRWERGGFASLADEYGRYDFLKGRDVAVSATDGDDEPVVGICGGVQPDGSLLVGDRPVYAGEAHVRSF